MIRMKMAAVLAVVGGLAAVGSHQMATAAAPASPEARAGQRVEGKRSTFTASIYGPSKVRSGNPCTWAVNVSGGTPPYTYSWNGLNVISYDQTHQSAYGSLSGVGNTIIWVDVTDANDEYALAQKGVNVTSSNPDCAF